MPDEKKEQTLTSQPASNNPAPGHNLSSTPVLDAANNTAKRMEDAAAALRAENDRTEQLMARRALGGQTQFSEELKKEESPADYVKKIRGIK